MNFLSVKVEEKVEVKFKELKFHKKKKNFLLKSEVKKFHLFFSLTYLKNLFDAKILF